MTSATGLVGSQFDRNDVGFVVPPDSSLRKRVNRQLLALHEDGTYRRIYAKWFGGEP
jgi:ABC-type amino acid transport substrate-binding protein